MQIKQEPKFQPITIVLETAEEAQSLWDAIERGTSANSMMPTSLYDLCGWFSNEAQLGGKNAK